MNKSATKSKVKALSDIYRDTEKGPVKIRTRARANGNLVVYLDIYDKGERRNVVLTDDEGHPLYLWPEKGAREREKNRATWEMARYCKSEYILTGMTAAFLGLMSSARSGAGRFCTEKRTSPKTMMPCSQDRQCRTECCGSAYSIPRGSGARHSRTRRSGSGQRPPRHR